MMMLAKITVTQPEGEDERSVCSEFYHLLCIQINANNGCLEVAICILM